MVTVPEHHTSRPSSQLRTPFRSRSAGRARVSRTLLTTSAIQTGPTFSDEQNVSTTSGVLVVLTAADVARVTDRIAHQIIENVAKSGFDAVLLGIPTRGVPLAQRLAARIELFAAVPIPVGSLDITLYRDDLRLRGVRPVGRTIEPPGGVDGRLVILVDDVLCSGRSRVQRSTR